MTTIAWDLKLGEIACDSRSCTDGIINSNQVNKHLEKDGYHFFLAGWLANQHEFCSAFIADELKVSKPLDIHAIVWDGSGLWEAGTEEGTLWRHPVTSVQGAIGSGSDFAVAAMDHGCTPTEAVRAASKRDAYTGGRIKTFQIKKQTGGGK